MSKDTFADAHAALKAHWRRVVYHVFWRAWVVLVVFPMTWFVHFADWQHWTAIVVFKWVVERLPVKRPS